MRYGTLGVVVVLAAGSAVAQQSASYVMEEHALNAGGSPQAGTPPASTGFLIDLSSLGDGLGSGTMSGPLFQVHGGFLAGHAPAGEVMNLAFGDAITLRWDPEPTAGTYNLYRDLLSNLGALGYGSCQQSGLSLPTAPATAAPPLSDGYFYLVTAENTTHQEGPKGFQGGGAPRLGPTCP